MFEVIGTLQTDMLDFDRSLGGHVAVVTTLKPSPM